MKCPNKTVLLEKHFLFFMCPKFAAVKPRPSLAILVHSNYTNKIGQCRIHQSYAFLKQLYGMGQKIQFFFYSQITDNPEADPAFISSYSLYLPTKLTLPSPESWFNLPCELEVVGPDRCAGGPMLQQSYKLLLYIKTSCIFNIIYFVC